MLAHIFTGGMLSKLVIMAGSSVVQFVPAFSRYSLVYGNTLASTNCIY